VFVDHWSAVRLDHSSRSRYRGAVPPFRNATLHDLPGAYRVCLQTGDAGRDATALYRDPDLLGHVFVGPYIVGEPDFARVVADDDGVGGYALAVADTRAFERWAEALWWPALRLRHPIRPGAASPLGTQDAEMIGLIHRPPRATDAVVAEYPAHLHIDLLARFRGRGLGRALIEDLADVLRSRGVPGVHLDVAADNLNAIAFYRHLGFADIEVDGGSIVMGLRLG
jgi:ribosomal protein S18 acetylase RimI-like enzyme